MLSVGSRDGGRRELGFELGFAGGGMEESELEEGEACSGAIDDTSIDPDIALSYLDEKLQDVLGHFQKDFEGGVSAENLGAKFGGYGSFLPTYQRSPSTWPQQPRSPPSASNYNSEKSSNEGVRQNSSVPTSGFIDKVNNATSASRTLDSLGSICNANLNAVESVSQHDNKTVKGSDQRLLKVRIKVGPDTCLARDTAAIYSGLGLDISPSSSPENTPDGSGGISPELEGTPKESPRTILQIMTCFSVPGGLLSPLPDGLLQLTKKERNVLKSCKAGMLQKGTQETSSAVADLTLPISQVEEIMEMKVKADEKNGRFTRVNNSNTKDGTPKFLKREIDYETPEGQKLVSDALNITILSGTASVDGKTKKQVIDDSENPNSRALDNSRESYMVSRKSRMSSPDLVQGNQLESRESVKDSVNANSGNKTTYLRSSLNSKSSMQESAQEGISTCNKKEVSSGPQKESTCNKVESDFVGYKEIKNHIARFEEPLELIVDRKATSYEADQETDQETILQGKDQLSKGNRKLKENQTNGVQSVELATSYEADQERILQGKDQLSMGNRKLKENQTNGVLSVDPAKGNMVSVSSTKLKEKKKSSHAKGGRSENISETSKSRRETSKGHSKSHRGGGVDAKQMENRPILLETHHKNKPKDWKLDYEKGPFESTEKSNESSCFKMLDNAPTSEAFVDAPENTSLMCNALNSDTAVAPQPHVLINQNWAQCDVCQKWRLLPPGVDPDRLPNKWQCKMQTWLPGLNRCHISEEVSNNAFYKLYPIPGPEVNANLNGNHEVAASTIASTDARHLNRRPEHDMRSRPNVGKQKTGLKDEPIVQNSAKSRSYDLATESTTETNLNKFVGHTSKSSDHITEKHNKKHKGKHEIQGRYSDGGDFIVKNGKQSKLKSKRDVDQGGSVSSMKIKREGQHHPIDDWHSNSVVTGKATLSTDNDFSTKVNGKNMQKYDDYTFEDLKSDRKSDLPASTKRSKCQDHAFPNGEFEELFSASGLEKSSTEVVSAKKRKVKDRQVVEGQPETLLRRQPVLDNRAIVKEAFSESELRSQKKAKLSTPDGKVCDKSKVDGIIDKVCSTRTMSSGSRERPPDRMHVGRGIAGNKQKGQDQCSAVSQRDLDCTDYPRRDIAYAQPPVAATSSSSKVSGSRRSKSKFREERGSPVGSVSSSPLRTSNMEMLSTRRNSVADDNLRNIGLPSMGSPKRFSDGEVDGRTDQSGSLRKESAFVQKRILESHGATDSRLDPLRGTCDFHDKEQNLLLIKTKGGVDLKGDPHDDPSPPKFQINANCTGSISDKHNVYGFKEQKGSCSQTNVTNFRMKAEICSDDPSTEDFRDENYNVQGKRSEDYLQKKSINIKLPVQRRKDGHSDYGIQENLDAHGPPMLPKKRKDFDSRVVGASSSKSNVHENFQHVVSQHDEKLSSHFHSDKIGGSEVAPAKRKSQSASPKCKQETQSCDPQVVPAHVKGRSSEVHTSNAANNDAPKAAKQSREPDSQNVLRQTTPTCPAAPSPISKDGQPAATAMLKEARDLKHTANRLKKEGLELESTGLYFEAALKFLHVASVLEPPSFESARHGESIQSIQMYSDTAGLCEYCAHEYERCKEMAAAALAYKCVEVAYMKVAYYKNPSANKDRHELQAALQVNAPGESPSSSASDVDNLNNHGTLDKTASVKGTASPQVAGNHIISARNRPNFLRLLNFTNYSNCAFEATRKSENAFAAASMNLGKSDISSVREVLDFNFHNVQGLLRLVRLSMESIGR